MLTKKLKLTGKKLSLAMAALTMLAGGPYAQAADIEAGKAKSIVCGACHGAAGVSSNPEWPHLAGQQEVYLKNQLLNFRAGQRKNPLMAPMAAGLSDDDIDNLAAYFASLKKF